MGTTAPIGIDVEFYDSAVGGADHVVTALKHRSGLTPTVVTEATDFGKLVERGDAELLYLLCHGDFNANERSFNPIQQLRVGHGIITGARLSPRLRATRRDGGTRASPIAFINACRGGLYDTDRPSSIVTTLHDAGASATVGPLVDIPSVFGAAFGAHVLEQLARREITLAYSVLDSSTYFWEKHGNLLGLTYSSTNGTGARLRNPLNLNP